MAFLFANNAKSTLAAPINAAATSLTLTAGTGALFPNPTGGDEFALTLVDAATASVYEIVYCTHRAGDVCTVVRGQEGTSPSNWTTGDFANLFITAGQMATTLAPPAGGSTAARPTGATNPAVKLYQTYFDTTLGTPIWCNQVTPTVTWVNAAGVSV